MQKKGKEEDKMKQDFRGKKKQERNGGLEITEENGFVTTRMCPCKPRKKKEEKKVERREKEEGKKKEKKSRNMDVAIQYLQVPVLAR